MPRNCHKVGERVSDSAIKMVGKNHSQLSFVKIADDMVCLHCTKMKSGSCL